MDHVDAFAGYGLNRLRRTVIAVLLLALTTIAPRLVRAHPPVGIVMDARGNVFYSDLTHVWRIAPDGRRTIAVRNVHTHELALDTAGHLFGEHLWYEGDATKRWGHFVWRLRPSGQLDTIVGPKAGFLTDYAFARDGTGAMYWVDRDRGELRKRAPGGRTVVVARHAFRQAGWLTVAADGTVHLTDAGDLLRIDPAGRVTTVARGLAARRLTQVTVQDRHLLMGLWTDAARHVFVARWGHRDVERIAPDGRMSIVATSGVGWGPSGGMIAPNGDLWLLETSLTNAVRVRRRSRDGRWRTW